ncbi:MAG TPA: hypothetical protein VFX23_08405 [Limnobacter sp.]|uniref:hypothetical protein n=1 Tax=Limnobacter sp. TaxID=2003368 RepID=UPI002E30C1EF|nr:hypothetical protein [Limnobacter sp.]HEX5486005.1 hypothetical protein [Limnobacter sp.]
MANSSASILDYIGRRAILLINLFLVLSQGVTLVCLDVLRKSYFGLQNATEAVQSANTHASSINWTLCLSSSWMIALLSLIFLGSVYKEFKAKSKKARLLCNLGILAFFVLIFALASYSMYTPILNT